MDPILQQIMAFAQAHGLDPRALIAQMGGGASAAPQMPPTAPMQGRMPSGPVGVAVPQGMAQGMPAGMPTPQGISMGMPRDDRMPGASFLAGPKPPALSTMQGATQPGLSGRDIPGQKEALANYKTPGAGMDTAGMAALGASLFAASKKEAPKMEIPQLSAYRYDPRVQNFKYDPNLLTGLLG
jgi:hypothetical protein